MCVPWKPNTENQSNLKYSIESIDSEDLPIHHKILKNNLVIIENLCNLDQIDSQLFTFCALPLKFLNSDGASVRAVAIID